MKIYKWDKPYGRTLDNALHSLTLGRVHHAVGDLLQARNWLEQAVTGLRESGRSDHLPRGLLARAALYCDTNKFNLAQQDLAEVWEIAESGEMRLFMADYHLEMARLLLAENPPRSPFFKVGGPPVEDGGSRRVLHFEKGETEGIFHHIYEAERLINETGYHRRDPELADLKQQIELAES